MVFISTTTGFSPTSNMKSYRQACESAEAIVRNPTQFGFLDGQFQVFQAAQQCPKKLLSLGAGQLRAKAVMLAPTESKMAIGMARGLEPVRLGERRRIAVGGANDDGD